MLYTLTKKTMTAALLAAGMLSSVSQYANCQDQKVTQTEDQTLGALSLADMEYALAGDTKVQDFIAKHKVVEGLLQKTLAELSKRTEFTPRAIFVGPSAEVNFPGPKVLKEDGAVYFKTMKGLVRQQMDLSGFGVGMGMRVQGGLFMGFIGGSDTKNVPISMEDFTKTKFSGIEAQNRFMPTCFGGGYGYLSSGSTKMIYGFLGDGPTSPIGFYGEIVGLSVVGSPEVIQGRTWSTQKQLCTSQPDGSRIPILVNADDKETYLVNDGENNLNILKFDNTTFMLTNYGCSTSIKGGSCLLSGKGKYFAIVKDKNGQPVPCAVTLYQ